MRDDVTLNKIAIVERCLKRIREDYIGFESEFESNFLRQDAILLNLQRACEACIDLAAHIVRLRKLGLPQKSRDVFVFLQDSQLLTPDLSQRLQGMVGFRNIAVHNYQQLNLQLIRHLLENRLTDFQEFTSVILDLE